MTLRKDIVIDRIEILEDGQMQVRQATKIYEDDVLLSQSFHRHVVVPGDDLNGQDAKVADVAAVVHTSDVVKKFKDKQEKVK